MLSNFIGFKSLKKNGNLKVLINNMIENMAAIKVMQMDYLWSCSAL